MTKRRVFYFSGFDPRGPAYYHRLYREEAGKQARINGMPLEVGPRVKTSEVSNGWTVRTTGGEAVETTYEFMRWDDIVRRHWLRDEFRLVLASLCTYGTYLRTGTLWRVLKTAWPPFITGLYPVFFLFGMLALAVGAGLQTAEWAHDRWGGMVAAIAGIVAAAAVLLAGRAIERRLNSYWLLRIYAFTAKQGTGRLPDLEERLDAFADRLVQYLRQSDDDEVLCIGHSTGTMIVVSALARALERDPQLAERTKRIALVTLGHCIPMLSLLPQARAFRAELARVAGCTRIEWIDFTAPTDGACFALTDPVGASGIVLPQAGVPRPKLLSPRFATLFDPKSYARIKRNWFRNHFQYLMAGELKGDYDYFLMTAGSLPLHERYAGLRSVSNYRRFRLFK